jgi:hypothetical protein
MCLSVVPAVLIIREPSLGDSIAEDLLNLACRPRMEYVSRASVAFRGTWALGDPARSSKPVGTVRLD